MAEIYDLITEKDSVDVYGARVHNLKNIDVSFPRNKLVVITGLSGSGKSSLAFDTIYAEGQRRYMETFSAYSRQFMGNMERPDVDKIEGLSPVISIDQKTTSKNPRSTVGTITEVYDYLRLLYARVAIAYSYKTGEAMVKMTEDEVIENILTNYKDTLVAILAPVVKGRKGHYRELFEQIRKQGFNKVRIDGEVQEVTPKMQVDRYKVHDIEVVIDRIKVGEKDVARLTQSVRSAMKMGKGVIKVMNHETQEAANFSKFLMCPTSGLSYDEPQPNTFSFNSPYGACANCSGLGFVREVDLDKFIPSKTKSIREGAIPALGEYKNNWTFNMVEAVLVRNEFDLDTPFEDLSEVCVGEMLNGTPDEITVSVTYNKYDKHKYSVKFEGLLKLIFENMVKGRGKKNQTRDYIELIDCPTCKRARLKKESLHFKIAGKSISDLANFDLKSLFDWVVEVESTLTERQQVIGQEIFKEIKTRIQFLLNVGLTYLTLDRPSGSLSGGEAQRIRLATRIGSQLVNVLYILDEPSIGLHQRDNHRLINALKDLRDMGNSVLVVEHDKDMILEADYVLDIGPAAGVHGGKVMAQGTPAELLKGNGVTADYLSGRREIETPEKRREGTGESLTLKGVSGNNLKNVDAEFPLGKFICVSGVSGSGKSTLITETLYPILSQHFYHSVKKPKAYTEMTGLDLIDKVIEIDQSAIGRTPRSNPATYTGVFTDIRKLFTELPEAKIRGYKIGRFSFNVKGGRCEECEGGGVKVIEMNFLPDVEVPCEKCQGKRYNRETLEVRYRGKSISDVLGMSIEDACLFFEHMPSILRKIQSLNDVGLGYLTLGQSSTTISGGEAQRVKLATELSKKDTGQTFYILDEPTTGLHFEDIRVLTEVLNRLVDKGNTVLVIEHNLDIIKLADHIIDLGPEGGEGGGEILFTGTPEELIKVENSHTGKFLKLEMK